MRLLGDVDFDRVSDARIFVDFAVECFFTGFETDLVEFLSLDDDIKLFLLERHQN